MVRPVCSFSPCSGAPDAHQHLQPGQTIHAITGSNHIFTGSKTQTWEGGIREPGIVLWKGKIVPQVRRETVSTMDVFATIADAANIAMPTGREYDSFSLLPIMMGQAVAAPRNASFFYQGANLYAVRVGKYKAHLITTRPNEPHAGPERGFLPQSGNDHEPYGVQDPWLLFNVDEDPSEMFPVTGKAQGPILAEIAAVVARHRKSLGTPPVGVLDHNCKTVDCRVCCDPKQNCHCTKPPKVDL